MRRPTLLLAACLVSLSVAFFHCSKKGDLNRRLSACSTEEREYARTFCDPDGELGDSVEALCRQVNLVFKDAASDPWSGNKCIPPKLSGEHNSNVIWGGSFAYNQVQLSGKQRQKILHRGCIQYVCMKDAAYKKAKLYQGVVELRDWNKRYGGAQPVIQQGFDTLDLLKCTGSVRLSDMFWGKTKIKSILMRGADLKSKVDRVDTFPKTTPAVFKFFDEWNRLTFNVAISPLKGDRSRLIWDRVFVHEFNKCVQFHADYAIPSSRGSVTRLISKYRDYEFERILEDIHNMDQPDTEERFEENLAAVTKLLNQMDWSSSDQTRVTSEEIQAAMDMSEMQDDFNFAMDLDMETSSDDLSEIEMDSEVMEEAMKLKIESESDESDETPEVIQPPPAKVEKTVITAEEEMMAKAEEKSKQLSKLFLVKQYKVAFTDYCFPCNWNQYFKEMGVSAKELKTYYETDIITNDEALFKHGDFENSIPSCVNQIDLPPCMMSMQYSQFESQALEQVAMDCKKQAYSKDPTYSTTVTSVILYQLIDQDQLRGSKATCKPKQLWSRNLMKQLKKGCDQFDKDKEAGKLASVQNTDGEKAFFKALSKKCTHSKINFKASMRPYELIWANLDVREPSNYEDLIGAESDFLNVAFKLDPGLKDAGLYKHGKVREPPRPVRAPPKSKAPKLSVSSALAYLKPNLQSMNDYQKDSMMDSGSSELPSLPEYTFTWDDSNEIAV